MGVGSVLKKTRVNINQTKAATRQHIPVSLKLLIWRRDNGKCQHFNPINGKKCGSSYLLEIDHIKRLRHGGGNDPKNLQLLCHSHNHLRG